MIQIRKVHQMVTVGQAILTQEMTPVQMMKMAPSMIMMPETAPTQTVIHQMMAQVKVMVLIRMNLRMMKMAPGVIPTRVMIQVLKMAMIQVQKMTLLVKIRVEM
jgi:hypothetical protein